MDRLSICLEADGHRYLDVVSQDYCRDLRSGLVAVDYALEKLVKAKTFGVYAQETSILSNKMSKAILYGISRDSSYSSLGLIVR